MSPVERAIALRRVEAFRRVPMEQLAQLAAVAAEQDCEVGHALFSEGDRASSLYVVLSGKIRLERGGKPFAETGEGESLGTWSLFRDEPRRASAIVAEDARILVLERDDFYDVLAENVEITRSLVQDLVGRLIELTGIDSGEKR